MPDYPLYQPHPTLSLEVDDEARARAWDWLENVRQQGRLDDADLERRRAIVATARDRGELNAAFLGLVHRPAPVATMPAMPVARASQSSGSRGVAALGHFSWFLGWLFGPAIVFFCSQPGTYHRREAAKAFNFQFVSLFIGIATLIVSDTLRGLDFLFPLGLVVWLTLTVVGGIKAAQGEDWRNPVTFLARIRLLDEGQPQTNKPM